MAQLDFPKQDLTTTDIVIGSPYRKPERAPSIHTKAAASAKYIAESVIKKLSKSSQKEIDRAEKEFPKFYDACMIRIAKAAHKGEFSLWYTGQGAGLFTKWSYRIKLLLIQTLAEEGFKIYTSEEDIAKCPGLLIDWKNI